MKTELQGEKVTITSCSEVKVNFGEESLGMLVDVTHATPVVFRALQLKAESAFEVLSVAMRDYHISKNTYINEREDPHELQIGSALHQNVNLILADSPYSTPSAQGQASSAHIFFCKRDMENTVGGMSNVIVSGSQGHMFHFEVKFFYLKKSVSRQAEF